MTAAEIASLTGCSIAVAEECIAKRPGNEQAQIALARLKADDQRLKAEKAARAQDEATKVANEAQKAADQDFVEKCASMICDNCGQRKPGSHFKASRGICNACVRNPGI